MTDNYAEHGLRLLEIGFEPVPVAPGTKKPDVHDWSRLELTEQKVSAWAANGRADHGVGLRTGRLVALDLDIEDPDLVDEMVDYCREHIGPSPRRTGKAPRAMLMYQCDQPMTKRTSAAFEDWMGDHKLEVMGQGQQVVAFGIHPGTLQPYHWDEPLLPLDQLAKITPEQVQDAIAHFETLATAAKMGRRSAGTGTTQQQDNPDWDEDALFLANLKLPLDRTDEQVKEDLDQLDPDMGREPWLRIGMGLHHQYAGSEHGYNLWNEWSSPSDKYDEEKTRIAWDSFSPDADNPVTFGSVILQVKEAQAALAANPAKMIESAEATTGFTLFDWASATVDREVPHQIVENLLVRGQVSLISAQPNTGKSAFILDLVAHIACGANWREDVRVEQCDVLYLAAESPESILSRVLAMKKKEGWEDLPLRVTAVKGEVRLAMPAERQAFISQLKAHMEQFPATRVVVLDTYRNATPGLEENSAKEMGAVVQFLHEVADHFGIHLCVVHHTTKSGSSYAGSGAFGAIVDTEIRIEVQEKEKGFEGLEKLIKAFVVQQRSLTGKGDVFWYEIEGHPTGRMTNFDTLETAPLVRHILDKELKARRVEMIEAAQEQAKADRDVLIDAAAAAVNQGATNWASREPIIKQRMAAADKAHVPHGEKAVAAALEIAAERGLVGASGEVKSRRYFPRPTAENDV